MDAVRVYVLIVTVRHLETVLGRAVELVTVGTLAFSRSGVEYGAAVAGERVRCVVLAHVVEGTVGSVRVGAALSHAHEVFRQRRASLRHERCARARILFAVRRYAGTVHQ